MPTNEGQHPLTRIQNMLDSIYNLIPSKRIDIGASAITNRQNHYLPDETPPGREERTAASTPPSHSLSDEIQKRRTAISRSYKKSGVQKPIRSRRARKRPTSKKAKKPSTRILDDSGRRSFLDENLGGNGTEDHENESFLQRMKSLAEEKMKVSQLKVISPPSVPMFLTFVTTDISKLISQVDRRKARAAEEKLVSDMKKQFLEFKQKASRMRTSVQRDAESNVRKLNSTVSKDLQVQKQVISVGFHVSWGVLNLY